MPLHIFQYIDRMWLTWINLVIVHQTRYSKIQEFFWCIVCVWLNSWTIPSNLVNVSPTFMLFTVLTSISFITGFQRKFSRKFIGLGGSHKRLHEICMLSLTSPHTPYHSPQHLLISCITCPSCLLPKRVFFFPYCSPWHPPSSFVSASSITQNKSRCPSMGVA